MALGRRLHACHSFFFLVSRTRVRISTLIFVDDVGWNATLFYFSILWRGVRDHVILDVCSVWRMLYVWYDWLLWLWTVRTLTRFCAHWIIYLFYFFLFLFEESSVRPVLSTAFFFFFFLFLLDTHTPGPRLASPHAGLGLYFSFFSGYYFIAFDPCIGWNVDLSRPFCSLYKGMSERVWIDGKGRHSAARLDCFWGAFVARAPQGRLAWRDICLYGPPPPLFSSFFSHFLGARAISGEGVFVLLKLYTVPLHS